MPIILLLLIFCAIPAQAHESKVASDIDITAHNMELDYRNNRATFSDKVTVRFHDMTLTADKVDLRHVKQVKEIHAAGHVILTTPDYTISCERADFVSNQNKIELFGHIIAKGYGSVIYGAEAEYNIKSSIISVRSGIMSTHESKIKIIVDSTDIRELTKR